MFFAKRRKRKKEAEKKRLEELKIQEEQRKAEEAKKAEKIKESKKASSEIKAPVKKEPIKKPTVKKTPIKTVAKRKTTAKYEVFPEAGMFKYRLKTSCCDVIAISFGYSSQASAKNGIAIFKKSVETGIFEIITDKAGFTRYDLYGARGARVLIIGDFHETKEMVETEIKNIRELYNTTEVVVLDEIPEDEVKEELVPKQEVEDNPNGKYYLDKVDAKSYFVRLHASNGQLLMVSQRYASKQTAINGLDAIKRALVNQNFTIHRDQQNRYQFKLHNDNKQVLVSGETYGSKQRCISSIQSVIRFGGQSDLVEEK